MGGPTGVGCGQVVTAPDPTASHIHDPVGVERVDLDIADPVPERRRADIRCGGCVADGLVAQSCPARTAVGTPVDLVARPPAVHRRHHDRGWFGAVDGQACEPVAPG